MKLKALAAMCKRDGLFCLYDKINHGGEVTEQWLGTSSAMYPLSGLPYLTEDNLVTLFDITEKQKEKILFLHKDLPELINFAHTDNGETLLEREKVTIGYGGRVVLPYITHDGLKFIDNEVMSPLSDIDYGVEIYERRTTGSEMYFAAKLGFMIVGVFMPLMIIEEKFVENMETLAAKCRTALTVQNEREAARRAAEGEQKQLEV